MNGVQQVQYQSLKTTNFNRLHHDFEIWFGIRGSEVQILSPRPNLSIAYNPPAPLKVLNLVEFGGFRGCKFIYRAFLSVSLIAQRIDFSTSDPV
jgi:hypothetical protein